MGLLRDRKSRKAQKAYENKMKEAMEAQRRGRIQEFASLNDEAASLLQKLQQARQEGSPGDES